MKTSKLLIAATACGFFALLAACGGSASNDAAGTLMEAKRATTGTPAPAAAPVADAAAVPVDLGCLFVMGCLIDGGVGHLPVEGVGLVLVQHHIRRPPARRNRAS